jgi:hypothetical protein
LHGLSAHCGHLLGGSLQHGITQKRSFVLHAAFCRFWGMEPARRGQQQGYTKIGFDLTLERVDQLRHTDYVTHHQSCECPPCAKKGK